MYYRKQIHILLLSALMFLHAGGCVSCGKAGTVYYADEAGSGENIESRAGSSAGEITGKAAAKASGSEEAGSETAGLYAAGSEAADPAAERSAAAGSGTETEEAGMPEEICVYVCGAVIAPDVYYLPAGSRIADAISAAGGFAEDADRETLNLAAYAEDGRKIRVYTKEETASGLAETEAEENGADSGEMFSGNGSGDGCGKSPAKININTADAEALSQLPGIGEAKAEAIVRDREANGLYPGITDIMRVRGIKQGVFDQIRDLITVG